MRLQIGPHDRTVNLPDAPEIMRRTRVQAVHRGVPVSQITLWALDAGLFVLEQEAQEAQEARDAATKPEADT